MIKLYTFLAKVEHIWSLWNLRGFIIFSFSLQCILIIGASLRVQTAKSWVHRLIWLVYLLADWAAYYAIGLVVPINRLQDQLNTYDIHSFWAPFLLLHIGGPNTIAGFSLEDNELWDRSVLHIVVQAGATVISIYRSLSKRRLLAPTLLVFVAALTRYAGRILALYEGSMDGLIREIGTSKARNKDKRGAEPIQSIVIKRVEPMELAAHSYDLFQKYKGIFCALSIEDDVEAYDDRKKLFSRKPDQALLEMEMEVSLAYDLFYTKIWTIMVNEMGKILHIISLAGEVGALVLWALANKQGYHKVDIKLTNALLVGGLFLDVVSLLKLVFSDLAICHLIKWKRDSSSTMGEEPSSTMGLVIFAMKQLLWVRNRATRWVLFRRWSGSIKQFDWIRNKEDDCCGLRGLGERMTKTLGIEWGVSEVKLSDDFMNHIFPKPKRQKENSVGRNEPIANAFPHICNRLGVVHTFIVWHTATYWFYAINPYDEDMTTLQAKLSQFNELLSKYMMYLLFYHPKMILEGVQLEMSVADMIQKLKEIKDKGPKAGILIGYCSSSSDLDEMLIEWEQANDKMRLILKLAFYIVVNLESAGHLQEIMNEMWIDFLLYFAIHCSGRMHVQQLGNGGELLTLVWLMMTHLSLTIELPRKHFIDLYTQLCIDPHLISFYYYCCSMF
ncbi:hypothetical protein V2J09_001829 [Rumex salicifolius]